MKILYLITKSNWGGAQRHVFDLAVQSKKAGHEVIVALGGEGILRDRLREESISTRPIQEMWRDIHLSKDIISLGKIFNVIREERPDVLHLHSAKAAGLGSLVGRLLGIKKIIYTVHGFAYNEDRPLYQKLPIIFFSWLTMLFSTHVILLYEKERKQTSHFPYISHKLFVINPGIATPKFFAIGSALQLLQAKSPLSFDKRIIIGTIAELHPNKGLVYALEALEKLVLRFPSLLFFVIGEGDQRNALETMIKEKNLEKNVVLAGYIAGAAEYLKAFSLFLLPSVKEGLPYCLLEAGYAHLPVVATSVGGIPEIIEDMKSGILVQSKKPDELFHALEFLLKHKNIQREYARNLEEKIRRVFNQERMFAATLALYTSSTPQ